MLFITINNANIYYQEHGDASGTPIILIHSSMVERESVVMNANYVAKNNPKMMNEMIAIHGVIHGAEY